MIGITITFIFFNILALRQGPDVYPVFQLSKNREIYKSFFLLTKTRFGLLKRFGDIFFQNPAEFCASLFQCSLLHNCQLITISTQSPLFM